MRLCDLGLSGLGEPLESAIDCLYGELKARGLRFRPHVWLSDDWYTPEGIPGFAVPFYLAHPRLIQLELDVMAEVEGGTRETCLQILRHETGHALDHAFGLRRHHERRRLFGRSTEPYPDQYAPRPFSRSHVRHLAQSYAQSHPDEDFAETFAVWLTPGSHWRQRYAGWPAMEKLVYVDTLMAQLAGRSPDNRSRRRVAPLSRQRKSLRLHYRERQRRFLLPRPRLYDRDLRRLFQAIPADSPARRKMTAAAFLRRIKKESSRNVALRTGCYQYILDRIIKEMIERSDELDLRLRTGTVPAKAAFEELLTLRAPHYLHSGRNFVTL